MCEMCLRMKGELIEKVAVEGELAWEEVDRF